MSTLGRWRSSTGDWCKLAGWCSLSLPDIESALGPPVCQVIYEESCWHPRHSDITGVLATARECEREREREGGLEALQNKTAEESPRFLCQLIYVALWLGVATEPDTCWSPHDWTHLWFNWTLQEHLDTDDIRTHRQTHTHKHTIPINTRKRTTCMHTPTRIPVHTLSHSDC